MRGQRIYPFGLICSSWVNLAAYILWLTPLLPAKAYTLSLQGTKGAMAWTLMKRLPVSIKDTGGEYLVHFRFTC